MRRKRVVMSEEIGVLLFVVLLCVWQCMLGFGL